MNFNIFFLFLIHLKKCIKKRTQTIIINNLFELRTDFCSIPCSSAYFLRLLILLLCSPSPYSSDSSSFRLFFFFFFIFSLQTLVLLQLRLIFVYFHCHGYGPKALKTRFCPSLFTFTSIKQKTIHFPHNKFDKKKDNKKNRRKKNIQFRMLM